MQQGQVPRQVRRVKGAERGAVEWPSLALLGACYGLWCAGIIWLPSLSLAAAIVAVAVAGTLHSSLSHEALHGHPTRYLWVNEALVFPALSLLIPYQRFRDTHLAHHQDARLTDPYDDPESNYMDPAVWRALPAWRKGVLRANNTLLGRMLLGPIVGQIAFMHGDWQLICARTPGVLAAWLWHIPALGVVLAFWAGFGQMPFWALALGSYGALTLLKIRTFLEHRAHEKARARTVIVEDRGPLALLFLNNNLHVVHHAHPQVAWYQLPALYRSRKEAFLRRNEGYVYRSYGQIFRHYFLCGKDPVPHPLWPER
ncbi:MAG: fatty acid desaturase [Rhodobacteraceae bacterium]|nr:fatty acid desaturase [Paracoccaceae bacterium]